MADLKTRLIQLLDLSRSFQQQLIADLDPVERDAQRHVGGLVDQR